MSPNAIAAVTSAAAIPKYGSQRSASWHIRHSATGATNGNRLMRMNRGAVCGPSHHVDKPVLRELTQMAMNDATTNSHVTSKKRPHPNVS